MKTEKVMVGMSGGVDSSVAAAVLLEQGYDVIGFTMKLWSSAQNAGKTGTSCFSKEIYDAKQIANKLGILHYVFDVENEFEEHVINYFVSEYFKGRTPNPCIACNKYIKFGLMIKKAEEMGVDYIATGHYAITEFDEYTGRYLLRRSASPDKDQTYVLYNLTQKQIQKTIFPLGYMTKDATRKKAADIQLAVAQKKDSQEICFVADNNYAKFVEERIPGISKPGFFVDTEGNVLGKHRGIIHYTIGQRRGLEIAFGKRMFVKNIDVNNNTVVLGSDNEVFTNELIASDVNFIPFDELKNEIRVDAKIRYKAKESPAIVMPLEESHKVKVIFETLQRAITPGQSVVFYDGDTVIGGGIIE